MQKLQLKDLLSSLNDPQPNQPQLNTTTQQFLAAPSKKVKSLPLREQLKIQRETTYRNTQSEMDKWVGIVKLNRQKDTLDLTDKGRDNASNVSFLPSKPISSLDKKMDSQLKSMDLGSQHSVMKKEEQALAKVSPEEVKQRVKEARKQRTAQFNEEIKRRRISKIKSKLYHKIKKRQKNREEVKRVSELQGEEKKQFEQKMAKRYIKERIELKHRSKNQHIKTLLRFGKHNKQAVQDAMNEVNAIRRQQLQKNQQQIGDDLSDQLLDDNKEDHLNDLQQEIDQMERQEPQKKGIESMKFMKIGKEREIQQYRQEAKQLAQMLDENDKMIDEDGPEEKQLTRKVFGQENHQKLTQTGNKSNFIQRNLKQALESDAKLTEGIQISRLKDKYQPQRTDLNGTQAMNIHPHNNIVEENYREFQQQKDQEYDAQMPAENKQLKGWGSWAGPGISQPKVDKAAEVRKKLAKIEAIKKKRRDGQMAGVIVRETYNKDLKDYFVKKMPHNVKSSQQFDYLQSEPLGPQWNTMSQFKSNVKPKVITRAGEVIEAIKLPKYIGKQKK